MNVLKYKEATLGAKPNRTRGSMRTFINTKTVLYDLLNFRIQKNRSLHTTSKVSV
ncbi:hypothetical protein GCM10023262_02480 [Bartonella pachyuromydis]|uniref:Uncharacterized protein n=1 Tax=Bartonella pachyuromydis TaxID=931097 RepID=A0ABP8VEH4_9HYPH